MFDFRGVLLADGNISEQDSISHDAVRGGRRRSRWVWRVSRGVNNNIPAVIRILPRQPLQSDEMSPDEDALLLLLIYEHLKLHGHAKAAEVLEDHVKQVRTFVPKCSFHALIGARDADFLLASIKSKLILKHRVCLLLYKKVN